MAKPSSTSQKRKPRLLWANPFCLMDTSSGASMTVRQMLLQLATRGYEIQVLGATVSDNPRGMGRLEAQYSDLNDWLHQVIEAEDGQLTHQLVVTASTNRNHLTAHEEGIWYTQYLYLLDSFKPDVVWFYGGQTLDLLIADEARNRGVPVAFYLANGNYKATRWCRDIDLILTDSQATADMYRQAVGFTTKPIGKFIDPAVFIADNHTRERLLFVNPSWSKGASIFVQLAEKLERERPDIPLEVVEARAEWAQVLQETTQRMGERRHHLNNVTITPNTNDMRDPYSRARILIAPSLWWESSGRVLAEAMLNGIPALITNRGGMPEMVGDAGITFDFPEPCYEEPFQHLLSDEELQPLFNAVVELFGDNAKYQQYVERAKHIGAEKHHIDRATERLMAALAPLVKLHSGNKDFSISQRKRHRQNLASRIDKPKTFKVDRSLQQPFAVYQKPVMSQLPKGDFTWHVQGKIIVIDSRARLIKSGQADKLAETGGFGIVAFDPASEVADAQQYEGNEAIQVFQHTLLGDGKPATLYACVSSKMTGILVPLSAEKLPEHRRVEARKLTELSISTVALDAIQGLGSLDWLILDELSDINAVLNNGKQALKDTLLIQARIALQPTHERQPNLTELQHWASRSGFRFYRFHNVGHYSRLPEDIATRKRPASEQESADVLLLPSHERMATLSNEQKMKLALVLSRVFDAQDMAFELISSVEPERGIEFLEAEGLLVPKPIDSPEEPVQKCETSSIRSLNHTREEKVDTSLCQKSKVACELNEQWGKRGGGKNIILMLSFGNRPWVKHTYESARRYAENIGVEFEVIKAPPNDGELPLPVISGVYGRKNKEVYAYKLYFPWKYMVKYGYERVMLIDDSAVVRPNAPDIFNEVPAGYSGYAWNQLDETLISLAGITAWMRSEGEGAGQAIDAAESFFRNFMFGNVDGSKLSNPINLHNKGGSVTLDLKKYANTAVMVYDKSCMNAISPKEIYDSAELLYSVQPGQTLWWYLLSKHNAPVYKIENKWNWLLGDGLPDRRSMRSIESCQAHKASFITHVTSAYKYRDELICELCNSMADQSKAHIFSVESPRLFQNALSWMIRSSKQTRVIQVGANDGKINDPIYDLMIRNKKKTRIALLEPQLNLIPHLKKNYRSHPNAQVLNLAVGKDDTLVLYRVNPSYHDIFIKRYLKDSPSYRVPSGFSSFSREHVVKHITGNLPDNISIEEVVEKVEVPCVYLKTVMEKLQWNQGYDVLQIDTEGMDDVVIYSSSLEFHKPKLINFEHAHLKRDKYYLLCDYLGSLGYSIYQYSSSDTLATLIGVKPLSV